MIRFTPLILEYNSLNGFIFGLLSIENKKIESSLLGLYIYSNGLTIEIFYYSFEVSY